jgi:hypothetical protein
MTKVRLGAYFAGALAPALLTTVWPVAAQNLNFAPTTAISLPNGAKITSFDISYVNPTIGLYLLGDRTNKSIDVVDTATNQVKALLHATPPFAGATGNNNTSGPDGVFTVNNREVWAGDGNSTVKVIDLFSQQTTHVINTGGTMRADEGCWDPRDNVVLIANDAEVPFPFISFIATKTYTVQDRITMDGSINGGSVVNTPKATNGIEQCQWDSQTGHFFINIPENNGPGNDTQPGVVLEINPTTHAILNSYTIPLASCAGPQGMAIGPTPQILLGCNATANANNPTAIINKLTGAVIATVNQQSGSDEVAFNSGDGFYFLARSSSVTPPSNNQQLLGIIDSSTFNSNAVFTATTGKGNAHSVAADPVRNQVYVPTPSGASTNCSSLGGVDANGCIIVFTQQAD